MERNCVNFEFRGSFVVFVFFFAPEVRVPKHKTIKAGLNCRQDKEKISLQLNLSAYFVNILSPTYISDNSRVITRGVMTETASVKTFS